jgi:signal transduction histidine kinase
MRVGEYLSVERWTRLGAWTAGAALVLACHSAAASPQPDKRILLLMPTETGVPWRSSLTSALRAFLEGPEHSVLVYSEEVDLARLRESGYAARLQQWLAEKYRDAPPDALVVPAPQSMLLLAGYAPAAWRDVPVVTVHARQQAAPPEWPGGVSGYRASFDVRGTVEEAAALVPGTRRVAVVSGAAPDERQRAADLITDLRDLPGLEIVDLGALEFNQLLARLRALPADAIVLHLGLRMDASGRSFATDRGMEAVAQASSRPVFGMFEALIGHGLVGGRIFDFEALGEALARVGQRLVAGESIDRVAFVNADFSRSVYDARELARWGLDPRQLPPGAELRNREQTLLEQYRWGVFALVAAFLLQAGLIVALLVERERRRRAEFKARRSLGQLAHLDRVAAMGELATSLAHELNQPLAAILANAQAARRMLAAPQPDLAEVRASLDDIVDDDKRAGEVIRRMRALLRKEEFQPGPVDLNDAVSNVQRLVAQDAERRGVTVALELAANLPPVHGDAVQLQQVVLNLFANAFDAVAHCPAERRRVLVRTREQLAGAIELSVEDSGDGIPDAHLKQLFEPFFTTKGDGLGMGLSITRSILELHGGEIVAQNLAQGGACFRCVLPPYGGARQARPRPAAAQAA